MNSSMYDDGCQDELDQSVDLYKTEQEYWEEIDRIHSLKRRGLLG